MGKGVLKKWHFLLYNMWTAPELPQWAGTGVWGEAPAANDFGAF